MPQGLFDVQIKVGSTGALQTVRVAARSRDDAIRRVVELGEIVHSAHLVEVLADPDRDANVQRDGARVAGAAGLQGQQTRPEVTNPESSTLDLKLRADNSTALALSWLGLIVGPLAVVGMIWGLRLMKQTQSRYGEGAFAVGLILTILWGLCLLALTTRSDWS